MSRRVGPAAPGGAAVAVAALGGAALVAVACGAGTGSESSSPACPGADPVSGLLHLDDLPLAGFTVTQAPQPVAAAALTGGDAAAAAALGGDGLVAAAQAHYFRQGVTLDTANGPVDVIVDAARFGDPAGAGHAYDQTVRRRDAEAGAAPVSTGPVGDSAHGDVILSSPAGGIPVVQYTVTVRVGALLDSVTVRGRQGGTGIGDAVVLALRQARRQCAAAT